MSLGLFRAITTLLPNPVVLCAADGRVLAANPAATRSVTGLEAGCSLYELQDGDREVLRRHLTQWLRSGAPLPGALAVKDRSGETVRFRCHGARARWWDGPEPAVQMHLSRLDQSDRFVALSRQLATLNREVAFRRSAEAERERLLAAEKTGRVRLQHLYRLTAALATAGTLAQVAEAVRETAPAAVDASDVVLELHSRRLMPAMEPADSAPPLSGTSWTDLDAPAAPPPPPHPPRSTPVRVPLEADGLLLGALTFRYETAEPPDGEHLTAVAQQIGQAVRRAGLYEHEHRLAERLQLSLLPQTPSIPGVETASCYAPGTDMVKVGGDWFDVHHLDADHIGITIGDIAGHGLPEAAIMAQTAAALRSIVLRCGTHPAAVLKELGEFLHIYHPRRMATACYLVYDRGTRTLRYARAGHPPPLLIESGGAGHFLDQALAPPLGPLKGVTYREAETVLPDDATLLLYTDGLIERRHESLDKGLARLIPLARQSAGLSVRDLCELFLNHHPDSPDDRALLAVRFPAGE